MKIVGLITAIEATMKAARETSYNRIMIKHLYGVNIKGASQTNRIKVNQNNRMTRDKEYGKMNKTSKTKAKIDQHKKGKTAQHLSSHTDSFKCIVD